VKDLKSIGSFYANSIQSDDYFLPVYFLNKSDLANLPLINDSNLMDESYADQKNLLGIYAGKNASPLTTNTTFSYPQSHASVLNAFRSDYEDFSLFQDLSLRSRNPSSEALIHESGELGLLYRTKASSQLKTESTSTFGVVGTVGSEVNPINYNSTRFSNPLSLRRTARSSMVTYQAFQKVFKLRYDEGRAHVRLTDFANSTNPQPYTTEQRVKYDRMLGKTRLKHFNTNFSTYNPLPVFNDLGGLANSLNYYFFEFPFLEGVTNDPTRHV
jgi:hypothetical protein